jgi:hypothetical protein
MLNFTVTTVKQTKNTKLYSLYIGFTEFLHFELSKVSFAFFADYHNFPLKLFEEPVEVEIDSHGGAWKLTILVEGREGRDVERERKGGKKFTKDESEKNSAEKERYLKKL